MKLKRDLVKYVRDKAKSRYKKSNQCYICGDTKELDFHHYYGLTELLETWLQEQNIEVKTEQDILNIREIFIGENEQKILDEAVTLCHKHHLKLHSVYGKKPKLIHAEKMKKWVEKQREKYGMV
tara:strand:- start:1084 stop:1455 length:372 start_codon:yes stop_codon:yes gene_type:complete